MKPLPSPDSPLTRAIKNIRDNLCCTLFTVILLFILILFLLGFIFFWGNQILAELPPIVNVTCPIPIVNLTCPAALVNLTCPPSPPLSCPGYISNEACTNQPAFTNKPCQRALFDPVNQICASGFFIPDGTPCS